MTCNLPEIRRQLNDLQSLLDTYEHFHVDSVTPEEKIVEKTKKACIEAVLKVAISQQFGSGTCHTVDAIKAIKGV